MNLSSYRHIAIAARYPRINPALARKMHRNRHSIRHKIWILFFMTVYQSNISRMHFLHLYFRSSQLQQNAVMVTRTCLSGILS